MIHFIFNRNIKIILFRHAQTNFNLPKLANLDLNIDVHLSEESIKQAESLARLLKDIGYDNVYISDLPRNRQTAEIIHKYHNKELVNVALLTINSATRRRCEFIDSLEHQPYESILVVTHGFMTQAIFGYLENKSLEEVSDFNFIQVTYDEFEI